MKATIKISKEVDLKTLLVVANIRHWEDATINGLEAEEDGSNVPCKNGGLWSPVIEIETGKILNWNQGVNAEIHFKVCDECAWQIKDINEDVVLSKEDGYVPKTLSPNENGYGDYIILSINSDGIIDGWDFDIEDFLTDED